MKPNGHTQNGYRDHLQSDDWEMKRQLTRWIFNGKCPACGDATLPYELHHNGYRNLPYERPDDVIPFCTICHATFEWAKKSRPEILREVLALTACGGRCRARLSQIGSVFKNQVRLLESQLGDIEAKIEMLVEMSAYEIAEGNGDVAYFWRWTALERKALTFMEYRRLKMLARTIVTMDDLIPIAHAWTDYGRMLRLAANCHDFRLPSRYYRCSP